MRLQIPDCRFQIERKRPGWFTVAELSRVGTAATMMVVLVFVVVMVQIMAMGHYNSLAQAMPKAVIDGAVIALLMGRQGRWRCLALLATVFALVMLLMTGVVYLVPVLMLAGWIGALCGWVSAPLGRLTAVTCAACVHEILAGCGAPVKIYFATGDGHEPILWALWFAEFPLRIAGAMVGVCLARRFMRRPVVSTPLATTPVHEMPLETPRSSSQPRPRVGTRGAALRLIVLVLASSLPLFINNLPALAGIAAASVIYGLWAGAGRRILHVAAALFWMWLVYALASYAWHQDKHRVADLLRTVVLRFAPLMIAGAALLATVRPVELFRVFRKAKLSGAVLLPFAQVVRRLPQSRRRMRRTMQELRRDGVWTGPTSLLRRPRRILAALLAAPLHQWASDLVEEEPR